MADIRINALATTAASTASDDYIAVDGSANGTRKLNAYSPTFGGNLTVSGTVTINSNVSYIGATGSGNGGNWRFKSDDGNTRWLVGLLGSGGETNFSIYDLVNSRQTFVLTSAGNTTLAGNLTVSGTGASTFGTTGKTSIQQTAGSGALVAGGWIYGLDEGLNFSPNGAGLNKKLSMAYFDGSAYRSILEYSNVSSGTATLKLSDYGGLTTVGGNLLVGLTVDGGQKLQVNGTAYASSDIVAGGALRVVGTATYYACIASGTALYYGYDNASLILRTNSANVLTLDSSKNATFEGNVGIGGTTPTTSGKGITFPATQSPSTDANTLDDYEEGPCSLSVSAGTGTITSYTITAYYTKIGRLVMINGYLEITNNGTGAGYLSITGLPFTSGYYASSGSREGGTHGLALSMIMNPSTTTINVYKYDNSYPVATGSNVPFTFSYMV